MSIFLRGVANHISVHTSQTSWTKRAVEVESPLPVSVWKQLADPPDSTCAQVILSRPGAFGNNGVPVITPREVVGQDNELGMLSSVWWQ